VKLQAVNPTHEQIKFVQSSVKSTQVWSSINNFSFWTNPLLANPIDSNQLSLKLWLKINHALEASWKSLNNHVWWCCVWLYLCVMFILIMVDCLQGIMRMGVLIVWRRWVMLTCYYGPWIIHHP
jgi:lipopolysaccharide export LptBFGC system permease protein LptF